MTIGITGSNGLIGWHVRAALGRMSDEQKKSLTVVCLPREAWQKKEELEAFVKKCHVIIHLAGFNKLNDQKDIVEGNPRLMEALTRACQKTSVKPHIVFSSTIHVDRDNPYGLSKKKSGEILKQWAMQAGGEATILILPNTFGEFDGPGKSLVSNFCRDLIAGKKSEVNSGPITLLYVGKVVEEILNAVLNKTEKKNVIEKRVLGEETTVESVYNSLKKMYQSYSDQIIPAFKSDLELRLFNCLRSYLFPKFYPRPIIARADQRGSLFEIVKEQTGGQAFFSTTKAGVTRGNHYHTSKIERFCVVRGKARISLRKLFQDKIISFDVDGQKPVSIDMPTFYTHNITNIGSEELLTLFWSNEIFDPDNSDTFPEAV